MEEVKKQGTESLFVPYKIALELKNLGFDECCFAFYGLSRDDYKTIRLSIFQNLKTDYLPDVHHLDVTCDAPLFHQTLRFFREKYMLSGEIYIFKNFWNFDIEDINNSIQLYTSDINSYSTYEKAEHECLKKLIEIAKEQNVK